MRFNRILGTIATGIMTVGMMTGPGLTTGLAAADAPASGTMHTATGGTGGQYQDRDRDYHRHFDRDDVARVAQDNGYRDGLQAGREDRENGRRFRADDNPMYRRAMSGYRWEFHSPDFYRQSYRDAFMRGYREGFRFER